MKAGDRRQTKKHGLQIRVHCMSRHPVSGQPLGRLFRDSKPVFAWRKPIELDWWDHHHLTPEERAMLPVAA